MTHNNQKPVQRTTLKKFQKYLCGGHEPWKLIESRDEDGYLELTAMILDAEMDPYKVTFGIDEDVTIETDGVSHIILYAGQLGTLAEMAENAAEILRAELDERRECREWVTARAVAQSAIRPSAAARPASAPPDP